MQTAMSNQEIKSLEFWEKYENLCIEKKICPLRCILKHLKGPNLICPVDYIRADHCSCVNDALTNDNSLVTINFFSNIYAKNKAMCQDFHNKVDLGRRVWPLPLALSVSNLLSLCLALGSCLKTSQKLNILKLENLPLTLEHIKLLCAGLPKCTGLRVLSLAGCHIGDESVQLLLTSVKHVFSVQWLNFSSCQVTMKSIEAIAEVLQFQSLIQGTEVWQHSLRYGKPDLEIIKGIDRLSLNDNSGIDDNAVKKLIETLTNDLWLKALDLQRCNITNVGAAQLLNVLNVNCIMQVLDLRLNREIDSDFLEQISSQISANNAGKTIKYKSLPLTSKPSTRKLKRVRKQIVNTEDSFEIMNEGTSFVLSALKEIEYLKTCLQEEKESKGNILKKMDAVELENTFLKEQLQQKKAPHGFVLIDNQTCQEIQDTFQKFSQFLRLLNEAGLKDSVPLTLREYGATLMGRVHFST